MEQKRIRFKKSGQKKATGFALYSAVFFLGLFGLLIGAQLFTNYNDLLVLSRTRSYYCALAMARMAEGTLEYTEHPFGGPRRGESEKNHKERIRKFHKVIRFNHGVADMGSQHMTIKVGKRVYVIDYAQVVKNSPGNKSN